MGFGLLIPSWFGWHPKLDPQKATLGTVKLSQACLTIEWPVFDEMCMKHNCRLLIRRVNRSGNGDEKG